MRGTCYAHLTSWTFDERFGLCYQFAYGGCGGNRNRFTTKQECQHVCEKENMMSELNLSYDIHSIVSGAPGLAANKQSKKTQKKPCDQESFSICEVSLAKSKSYTSYHTKFDVFNWPRRLACAMRACVRHA